MCSQFIWVIYLMERMVSLYWSLYYIPACCVVYVCVSEEVQVVQLHPVIVLLQLSQASLVVCSHA